MVARDIGRKVSTQCIYSGLFTFLFNENTSDLPFDVQVTVHRDNSYNKTN